MRFPIGQFGRRDIKSDGIFRQIEWVDPLIRGVQLLLDVLRCGGQAHQLRHREAIDSLDAFVHSIFLRQERVAYDPVEVGSLSAPCRPIVYAPVAGRIGPIIDPAITQITPTFGGAIAVSPTTLQGYDLVGGAGQKRRSGGKLTLVDEVDAHWLPQHVDGLDPRLPGEALIRQQTVVVFHPSQVMTVSITVSLWEKHRRISRVDFSILVPPVRLAVDVADIIVQGIDQLSSINPSGIVPEKAIVDRRHLDRW